MTGSAGCGSRCGGGVHRLGDGLGGGAALGYCVSALLITLMHPKRNRLLTMNITIKYK